MFTGIIGNIGEVIKVEKKNDCSRLRIKISLTDDVKLGESIALNGACMTVSRIEATDTFDFDISLESLKRTNLGSLQKGDKVNTERSLVVGARVDGHFVTGHVDSIGEIVDIKKSGDDCLIYIKIPTEYVNQVVSKGSITVDGISLTIIDIINDTFNVTIVPHTLKHTTLNLKSNGSKVNIETDVLAKYVQKNENVQGISKEFLTEAGF
ncbi:MAG: riboflavin synthase [Planctomycetota bacterium]|nr:MAG: riboflavin synthase [Planctomycetota bacterium]